jgi:arylsulfatase A-like enzyme
MKMHILLITIDSLRADHLACYQEMEIRTPNLDAFAASGARFQQHLSSLATTLPSHTSLLTGCVPSVHGVNWNGVQTPRRRTTLAEIATAQGYATTAITSWGGFQLQDVLGFEEAHSEGGAGAEENRGDQTLQRVEAWLDRVDASRPQFLWVHFIDPHTPDNCPDPFPQTYVGEVEFVDTLIGRFIAGWDERLGADNTFAAITADHGEHLNDHGVERGHGTLWITNLRIPLLVRCPGLIQPGSVAQELTRQIDVLPTILDYCELPMPYNVQGMSLRGLIEGRDSGMRLVHEGQAVHKDGETVTVRSEKYAFFFGDDGDLVHIFDRRVDAGEDADLWERDSAARQSVEHSLRDGRQS